MLFTSTQNAVYTKCMSMAQSVNLCSSVLSFPTGMYLGRDILLIAKAETEGIILITSHQSLYLGKYLRCVCMSESVCV